MHVDEKNLRSKKNDPKTRTLQKQKKRFKKKKKYTNQGTSLNVIHKERICDWSSSFVSR